MGYTAILKDPRYEKYIPYSNKPIPLLMCPICFHGENQPCDECLNYWIEEGESLRELYKLIRAVQPF